MDNTQAVIDVLRVQNGRLVEVNDKMCQMKWNVFIVDSKEKGYTASISKEGMYE